MIKSFKHKGLQCLFETGSKSGIEAAHAKKIALRLHVLDMAEKIEDVDVQGFNLHKLSGDRNGLYSIRVTANWRITFEFVDGDVYIVNYEDYH